MLFSTVIGLATLISATLATPKVPSNSLRNGHVASTRVDGAVVVEFPVGAGCDPVQTITKFLKAKNVQFSFRTVTQTDFFCGASLDIVGDVDHALDGLPGVVQVHPVVLRQRINPVSYPTSTGTPAPIEKIHTITGVNAARAAGFTGKGVKVAILDSGIYYKHPALGGGFGPGFKVSYGRDLVGDAYNGTNTPIPDNDPLDECSEESHGTHVAGIVGANALNIKSSDPAYIPQFPFTGVAPDVTLGAYRVFGCSGSTGNDVIADAIYQAAKDGSNVINLSLGGGVSYDDGVDAIAANRVASKGHIVVSANGNDGSAGTFVNSSPGDAKSGLGIASFDNIESPLNPITINNVDFPISFGSANGNFTDMQSLQIVINNPNAAAQNTPDDGCTPESVNPAVKGKTAFMRWGPGCGSRGRCNNAANAGAVACLLYGASVADDSINILGSDVIPSAFIKHDAGEAILKTGDKSSVVVHTVKQTMFPIATAGTVSSFSSPGLDPELHFKPDLGGIGGNVLSTVSPHAAEAQHLKSNYGVYSGTSMATPYVSGCIALLLQSNPTLTFEQVRAILQNTAVPAKIYNSTLIDSTVNQGAGLVNIYNAINTKTIVTPSALALNDTANTQQHYTIAITNNYKKDVTYTLSAFGAAQANPFVAGDDATQEQAGTTFTANYAKVTFNNDHDQTTTVKVPAGKSHSVNVHIKAPNSNKKLFPIYSGFVKLSNDHDDNVVTVPYTGMVGYWKDAPIFARNSSIFANSPVGIGATDAYINGSVPIFDGYTLNLTAAVDSIYLYPIAATTSRLAYISVIYAGHNTTVQRQLKSLGLGNDDAHSVAFGYGVDPLTGASAGAGSLLFNPFSRNSPNAAQSVTPPSLWGFDGRVYANLTDAASATAEPVQLPAGLYKFRFAALKHFEKIPKNFHENDFDVIYSHKFNLVY
ncbi:hypothetical protein HDU76_006728 [Blyttiomyces sp. JEL0837]|nr:hypothetical protein HDU76_006728 [Blyttiomyces sp. JEL0837]